MNRSPKHLLLNFSSITYLNLDVLFDIDIASSRKDAANTTDVILGNDIRL